MSDITTEILIDIRNELRETRGEIRGTNARLDRTNERLDRVVTEQIRHSTAIVTLEAGQRHMEERLTETIGGVTRAVEGLNARIDNVLVGGVGQKVREHESRLQRVEDHLGLTLPAK